LDIQAGENPVASVNFLEGIMSEIKLNRRYVYMVCPAPNCDTKTVKFRLPNGARELEIYCPDCLNRMRPVNGKPAYGVDNQ